MKLSACLLGEMKGVYYYKRYGEDLQLKGTYNGGRVMLCEYTKEGKMTGVFKGKFVTPNKIEGTWMDPSGTRVLPFTLVETNPSAEKQWRKTDDKLLAYSGEYRFETSSQGGSLYVLYAGNGEIFFDLWVARMSCTGDICGSAYFHNFSVANFTDSQGCHINFTFRQNEVEIRTENCWWHTGAACAFDGIYKKVQK